MMKGRTGEGRGEEREKKSPAASSLLVGGKSEGEERGDDPLLYLDAHEERGKNGRS